MHTIYVIHELMTKLVNVRSQVRLKKITHLVYVQIDASLVRDISCSPRVKEEEEDKCRAEENAYC